VCGLVVWVGLVGGGGGGRGNQNVYLVAEAVVDAPPSTPYTNI